MRAVILVGRGSAAPRAGATLIRLAARCRELEIASLVAAGFLRHCRPLLREALAQCVSRGATEIVLVPYALALTGDDRAEIEQSLQATRTSHPHVALHVTEALGEHPVLAQVLLQRALEADYVAAHHHAVQPGKPAWPIWQAPHAIGLVIVVDGAYTAPAVSGEEVASYCRATLRYANVELCFTEGSGPCPGVAIDTLVGQGNRAIIVVPYTLDWHASLASSIEVTLAAARQRHPAVTIVLAEHLAYDRRLLAAIAERVRQAQPGA
ncbi:MAG: cobalamin biosynthesis protein CbiX [Chloroflexi bacterium]|nr:cobalamin biosynthesis protein CbiX [Chloroflexota bacterium]